MALETVVPADVLPSAAAVLIRKNLAAGVTCTQGQPCAKDASGNLILAEADGSAAAKVPCGILATAGSPGQPAIYVESDPDFDPGFVCAQGIAYVVADTAGRIRAGSEADSGDTVWSLGIGKPNGKMNMKLMSLGAIA